MYTLPHLVRRKKDKCLKKLEGLEKDFWEGLIID